MLRPLLHHPWLTDGLPASSCAVGIVSLWAQAAPRQNRSDVLFWCAVALVIVVGAALAGRWAVRRLRQPHEPYTGPIGGFDLADLQRLRDQGCLTDDEHQRARAALIARHRLVIEHGNPDRLDAAPAPTTDPSRTSDKPGAQPPPDGGDNPSPPT